jgi:putative transposase
LSTGCQWGALDATDLWRHSPQSLVVTRPRPSKKKPQGLYLDKGYDYAEGRDTLKELGFTAHIRAQGEEAQAPSYATPGSGHGGGVVERTQSRRNRFRRVLIRWDKEGETYLAFLHFACALIAFRASGLFG